MRKKDNSPTVSSRISARQQALIFSMIMCSARVGFMAASYILLVQKFEVTTFNAAMVTIALQGFAVLIKRISAYLFPRYTLKKIQGVGMAIGATAAFAMIFTSNFVVFCALILLGSFAKISREITMGLINHQFVLEDKSYASKREAYEQAGVLSISVLIGLFAILKLNYVPIVLVMFLYASLSLLILKNKLDLYHHDEEFLQSSKAKRLETKNANPMDSIYKFKYVTLARFDTFSNLVSGISACLMPVVFKNISHISQGNDSFLAFTCGIFAFVFGLKIIPILNKKFNLDLRTEWLIAATSCVGALITSLFFTTYMGVASAYIAAMCNGICLVFMLSLIQSIASKEFNKHDFATFNCKVNQQAAIVRIAAPLMIGLLSKYINIDTVLKLAGLIAIFCALNLIQRVSIISREHITNRYQYKPAFSRKVVVSTTRVYVGNGRRKTPSISNYRLNRNKFLRRRNGPRSPRPSFNRLRDYHFEARRVVAFSQTYADMVTTWRSHRFRRNSTNYSAA